MTAPPYPPLCIGCGKDHPEDRPAPCGYSRAVRWSAYGGRERFAQIRLFPIAAGLGAAAIASYFLLHPPENPLYFYMGVAIPGLIALLVGGAGVRAFVVEVRKRRYRAESTDGRDRALVVMVGGELDYAFGESLKYEPVVANLEAARALSSGAALALTRAAGVGDDLDRDLLSWLRRDSGNEDLMRDPTTPAARLAILATMTVLGLAARRCISLSIGRYKSWGRGGGKMPKVTPGFEVAFETLREEQEPPEGPFERQMLALAAPGESSPTALDALFDAIADGRDAQTFLDAIEGGADAGPDDEALAAARRAWRQVQEQETETVMRVLQHVLPERPRTIAEKA